jgi:hypothetical protein
MLAAVDFHMRFTYVLVGWEGSTHDAAILADSLEQPDGLQVLEGKFYLADAGYACRPGLFDEDIPTELIPPSCKRIKMLLRSSSPLKLGLDPLQGLMRSYLNNR